MKNLNSVVANGIKAVELAYTGAMLVSAAGLQLKRKSRQIDADNEPRYLVVNIFATTTTSDLYNTKEEVEYDCKSPLMVTKDAVAAKKHFDYLRGQGRKVALLVTDPFQLFASSIANNEGYVPMCRSGLMPIMRSIDNEGKYSMNTYQIVIKDAQTRELRIEKVDGMELMTYLKDRSLVARIETVNGTQRFQRLRERNSGKYRYCKSRILEKTEILG